MNFLFVRLFGLLILSVINIRIIAPTVKTFAENYFGNATHLPGAFIHY